MDLHVNLLVSHLGWKAQRSNHRTKLYRSSKIVVPESPEKNLTNFKAYMLPVTHTLHIIINLLIKMNVIDHR